MIKGLIPLSFVSVLATSSANASFESNCQATMRVWWAPSEIKYSEEAKEYSRSVKVFLISFKDVSGRNDIGLSGCKKNLEKTLRQGVRSKDKATLEKIRIGSALKFTYHSWNDIGSCKIKCPDPHVDLALEDQ